MQISLIFLLTLFFIDNSPLDGTYCKKSCVQRSVDFLRNGLFWETPCRWRSGLFSHKIPFAARTNVTRKPIDRVYLSQLVPYFISVVPRAQHCGILPSMSLKNAPSAGLQARPRKFAIQNPISVFSVTQ